MYPTTGDPGGRADDGPGSLLASSGLPYRLRPDRSDPAWIRVDSLLDPDRWRDLGRRYGRARDLPHSAPGLACALQHYSGRVLQVMVAAWCVDGSVLDPDHRGWWAHVDDTGATRAVSSPSLVVTGVDDDEELARALHRHVDPLVVAARDAGNATERLLVGCVAASCAGAFAVALRGLEEDRRERARRAAGVVTDTFRSRDGRPTVTLVSQPDPTGAPAHDRHTCCLIRLAPDGTACGSCPHLPEPERRSRQRAAAAAPRTVVDLRGVS